MPVPLPLLLGDVVRTALQGFPLVLVASCWKRTRGATLPALALALVLAELTSAFSTLVAVLVTTPDSTS